MKTFPLNRGKYLSGASIFMGGFLSILVQAVVLRESLFGRHEAELASGIVLSAWIIGSGLGAAVSGRSSRHRSYWIAGMILLPLLGFLQVTAVRTGVLPLALTVFPAGFTAGVVFLQPFAFGRPSRIYAFEALGAAAGGGIFVLLSPHLLAGELLAVSVFVSILGLLSCRCILPGLILAAVLLVSQLLSVPKSFSEELGAIALDSFENVEVHPSPYGEVVTASRSGQHAVFRSGILEATWPAIESAEETVTVPLVAVLPRKVLYIGSSPEEAGIISGWPGVDLCITVIPESALGHVIDYPGEIAAGDGRQFLVDCEMSFDLIIVSAGQPLTLLANRFYTAEFMKLLAGKLNPDGVAAVHLPGGANTLHPLEAELAASVLMASDASFEWSRILPVSGLMLVAGNGPECSFDGEFLALRLDSLGVSGICVNSGTLPSDLSEFRTAFFEEQIAQVEALENRDLRPEGFRIANLLWDFRTGEEGRADLTIPVICLFLLIMLISSSILERPLVSLGVAAAGFTGLSVEVISLVAIQAVTGYSWMLAGAVTGVFMTGGALGAFLSLRGTLKKPRVFLAMSGLAALFCAAALQFYGLEMINGVLLAVCLFIGTLVCGISGGGAFTTAAESLRRHDTGRIGLLDCAEHGGSAAASLLMPLILFPVLGAVGTLMIAAGWVIVWTIILWCFN